jgi:hypothetical protein
VLLHRTEDAERERKEGGDHERSGHQFERRRQTLENHCGNRSGRRETGAQIAAQRGRQPAHVLHGQRLIHAEPAPITLDNLRIDEAARLEQRTFGSARRCLNHGKEDDADPEEQRNHLQQPA